MLTKSKDMDTRSYFLLFMINNNNEKFKNIITDYFCPTYLFF